MCYLGDAALHDEEVGVVDVQLHRVKQILHSPVQQPHFNYLPPCVLNILSHLQSSG